MESVHVERLDHLGLIASVIKDLGLIRMIDARIVPDEQEEITPGEAVAGMILNGLGFANRPLSLTPQFFAHTPLDLLFRGGVHAEMFNRFQLGRTLDEVYAYGCDLLFEEVAEDRTYTTGYALVEARLEALGVGVLYLVSDRAKALIKLAEQGLECVSIPDVFHLIHDLVKSYSLAICRPLRQARQALHQARESLTTCQVPHRSSEEAQRAQAEVEACEAEVERWESVHSAYRHHLETVSLLVHPWRLCNATPQTSQEVERRLHAEIDAITAFIATHGLPAKQKAVDKVRKQLAGVSALVDLWWQSVWHDGQQVAMTPMWQRWVDEQLLPLMYWQHQVSRTRCPRRKAKLVQALEAVQDTFDRHPITRQLPPDVLEGWKAWAAEHAKAFQRASSAVEGRNGALAQLHHHQRGLPKQRYKVWTVLHNFDCRAPDGTTPAARFFRRGFPDLFETVLSTIDDLPRPRKRHQAMTLSG